MRVVHNPRNLGNHCLLLVAEPESCVLLLLGFFIYASSSKSRTDSVALVLMIITCFCTSYRSHSYRCIFSLQLCSYTFYRPASGRTFLLHDKSNQLLPKNRINSVNRAKGAPFFLTLQTLSS